MTISEKEIATPDAVEVLPLVIYYRHEYESIPDDLICSLETDLNCQIEICGSWSNLITLINSQGSWPRPILMLVDFERFIDKDLTMSEMINMILTMHKCLYIHERAALGVVIEKLYTTEAMKELYESDILGIVPCARTFGYEHTVEALRTLIDQKSHWPKTIIDTITGKKSKKSSTGIKLTDRQQQVLTLVCNRGLSNKKIASVLKISESTVKIHVSAILKEYGVRNRTQLALAANLSLNP